MSSRTKRGAAAEHRSSGGAADIRMVAADKLVDGMA